MADNSTLNAGTGGDTIRDKDRAGVKTQIVGLDLNPAGSEVLGTGDATNGLDVDVTRVQGTVTVAGTVTANLAAGTNNIGDVDVLTMPATAADGGTQPATTVVVSGNDGSNVQTLKTDVNGILQTAVNGTVAVTDNSGSLTVDDGGSTLSVDDGGGSLTVDGTVGVSGTVTVDSELTTADLDTGAGTDTRAVVGLALAASGGAVLAGTANPVPISDNSGSITVDGTVTANAGSGTMAVSAAALPLPSGAATAAKQPALGTAGAASADVLSVQGVASMTALKVDGSGVTQPVSGTVSITANSSVNQAQIAGTATDTNSGVKSAGTQRVVLATDQPQLTNALKVDGSAATQPVSGTVTANAGTGPFPVSDNSGSLTVDAPVGTPVFVTATPSTTGGWSKIKYAAQTTTVQTVKGSAATFGGYYVYNPNATVAYVQVFDAATATTITLGTTVPDMIFGIPPSSAANLELTNGVSMANGIKLACTTTATGSTAPGTGLDLTVFYK